jgi:hypothetical protein
MDSGVEGWEVIDRKFNFVDRGATCSHLCIGHQRLLKGYKFHLTVANMFNIAPYNPQVQ